MRGFLLRRLAQAVVVLLGVTLIVFLLERLTPGSLAHAILGPRASPRAVAAFNAANGLKHPIVIQYLDFLGRLVRGNLGYSYRLNQSVGSLITHEAPNDLILVGLGLVVALAIALPLGIAQAVHRNRALDHVATGAALALYSMPSYWLALLLIAAFSIGAHVFPPEAGQSGATAGILADPRGLVLPVLTLTLVNVAWFSRYMRSAAIDTLAQDYVRLARAKGLPGRLVLSRHVLRNSLLAVVTLLGMSVPMLLTAGLVVEYVFNIPGVGLSYYTAAANADYPVELGVTVIVGLATVLGSLLADISYAILDPEGAAVIREFRRHRLGVAGVTVIALLITFCFLGPVIHPTDQVHANIAITNVGPSGAHLLGTDANGYDILGRLMVGGRDSLEIGVAVALLATLLGALWGAIAGLSGGALDALMMRVVDTLLALPAIFVLIYLATVAQPTVPLLIAVISLLSWLGPARLIRGETLSLSTREFVEAARAAGASRTRIIVRHLLPNTVGTLVVNATFQVADAIILLATLSFLGFGLPPPAATWGGMLSQGTTYLLDGYWWEVYPAGILIMLTAVAFNLVGDALRETVDSRVRAR